MSEFIKSLRAANPACANNAENETVLELFKQRIVERNNKGLVFTKAKKSEIEAGALQFARSEGMLVTTIRKDGCGDHCAYCGTCGQAAVVYVGWSDLDIMKAKMKTN